MHRLGGVQEWVMGKYRGPRFPTPGSQDEGGSSFGPVRSPAASGREGGGERGRRLQEEEGPGAPVTGWQPSSGRVAAAAPPPAAPLAAAAVAASASAAAEVSLPTLGGSPSAEQSCHLSQSCSAARRAESQPASARRQRSTAQGWGAETQPEPA